MLVPSALQPMGVYVGTQAIRAVAFHPSGESFVAGTNGKSLVYCSASTLDDDEDVVAARNGERLGDIQVLSQRLEHHFGSVYCVAWDPSGRLVATGSNDKLVRLLPVHNAQALATADSQALVGHTGTIRAVDFGQYGSLLASGGAGDCALRLWDASTGACISTFEGHTGHIHSLRMVANGHTMASGSLDGTVKIWDLRSNSPAAPRTIACGSQVSAVALDDTGVAAAGYVEASPSGSFCALLDIGSSRVVTEFSNHTEECRGLDFSPNGRWLLTGGSDNIVSIVDVQRQIVAAQLREHADKVTSVRWHPTTAAFASSSADRSALLWGMP